MDSRENLLRVYKELADWYERQRQPQMRDRFLVLAADAAFLAGKPDEAERLRLRLLKVNPHHMLKPYASLAQALKAPDVLTYVKDLRVNYPADVAEDLLRTLQADDKRPANPVAKPAPPVDFDGSLTSPLATGDEDPTFFNTKEQEDDLAKTAAPGSFPLPRPPARESYPQTLPLQPEPPRTAPARPVAGPPRAETLRPRKPAPAPVPLPPQTARTDGPDEAAGGSWFAVLLLLVVLAAGALLTGFTVFRPYLPANWLP